MGLAGQHGDGEEGQSARGRASLSRTMVAGSLSATATDAPDARDCLRLRFRTSRGRKGRTRGSRELGGPARPAWGKLRARVAEVGEGFGARGKKTPGSEASTPGGAGGRRWVAATGGDGNQCASDSRVRIARSTCAWETGGASLPAAPTALARMCRRRTPGSRSG